MTGNSKIRAISFGSLSTRLFFQIEEPTIVRADMNDNSRHSPKQHRHQCEILTVAKKKPNNFESRHQSSLPSSQQEICLLG
jgi:hypothetical protein